MVQITAGRYGKPKEWRDHSVIDPSTGRHKTACRWCGKPRQSPYHYYCSREHKTLWEAKYSPPIWASVRQEILKRDNHTCQICGVTEKELSDTWLEAEQEWQEKWNAGYRPPYLKAINWYRYQLEVDHIKPVKTYPDLEFNKGNLRTLCQPCHITHGANPRSRPKPPPPGQPRLHDYEEAA